MRRCLTNIGPDRLTPRGAALVIPGPSPFEITHCVLSGRGGRGRTDEWTDAQYAE